MNEKKVITKKDWASKFTLIGKPVINKFTYKIDERSEKSNWIYNALNLGVDCGERSGVVYCEMMGGYSENNDSRIYAYGKDENNNDDFSKQINIAWEDRFDDSILEEVGRSSFITVAIEKTSKGDPFYKDFLSAYDAIAYVKEHLDTDMIIKVRGNLKYSMYNNVVQVKKIITRIELSDTTNPSEYSANFIQSILIDKDSTSLKPENIDKDKGVVYVNARVLDYVKEINGVEIKGQFPYNKQFEYAMNFADEAQCKKIMDILFKVKRGITQVTMEGEFIESGAVIAPTLDDIDSKIKELVDVGVFSEEEAIEKCTATGSRERRMVIKKPTIKKVGDDDNKVAVLQKFEERYTEDDLAFDFMINDESDDEVPFEAENSDMDWLNSL